YLLEGARPNIDRIATDQAWETGGDIDGINLPSLLSLFQMIEAIGRVRKFAISKFVHDETASHEEAYHRTFITYRRLGESVIRFPNGDPFVYGLNAVSSFETQPSNSSPFIQAADLLAGSIGRACKKVDRGESMSPSERALNSLLFTPLTTQAPPMIAWRVTSEDWFSRLAAALAWTDTQSTVATPSGTDTLLPKIGDRRGPTSTELRIRFPSIVWGLMETTGHLLIVRRQSSPDSNDADTWSALPLFSTRDAAIEFGQAHYPNDSLRPESLGTNPES